MMLGEPVELRLRVARVEVLDVERRDRELVGPRPRRLGVTPSWTRSAGRVTSSMKLPKCSPGRRRAGRRSVSPTFMLGSGGEQVVERRSRSGLKSFGAGRCAAARRAQRRVRAVVADDRRLAEASSSGRRRPRCSIWTRIPSRVSQKSRPSLAGVEGAARLDVARRVVLDRPCRRDAAAVADHRRRGQRVAGRDDGDRRRASSVVVRFAVERRPGRNSFTRAVDAHRVADARRSARPGEDEDALGGRRVRRPGSGPASRSRSRSAR